MGFRARLRNFKLGSAFAMVAAALGASLLAVSAASFDLGSGLHTAGVPAPDQDLSDSLPAWFQESTAIGLLDDQARFETKVMKSVLAGEPVDVKAELPSGFSEFTMATQFSNEVVEEIRATVKASGLQYSHPRVEFEILEIRVASPREMADLFSEDRRPLPAGQVVSMTLRRVASMEIDLTGATDIEGFDPEDGLRTSSADEFVASFVELPRGQIELADLAWLAPADNATNDRPIGWFGTRTRIKETNP